MVAPAVEQINRLGPFSNTPQVGNLTFTPDPNQTYLVVGAWITHGTSSQPTVTATVPSGSSNIATGPTLVRQENTSDAGSFRMGMTVYWLRAVASPTGTTTVAFTPTVNIRWWTVAAIAIDSVAADPIVQFASVGTTAVDVLTDGPTDADTHDVDYVLPAAATSGNYVVTVAYYDDDTTTADVVTPTTGWTQLVELQPPGSRFYGQYRNDTATADVVAPQNSTGHGSVASVSIEIDAGSGAVNADVTPAVVAVAAPVVTPAVTASSTASVTATAVNTAATVGSVTAGAGSGAVPDVVAAGGSVLSPAVSSGSTVAPAVFTLGSLVLAPQVDDGQAPRLVIVGAGVVDALKVGVFNVSAAYVGDFQVF